MDRTDHLAEARKEIAALADNARLWHDQAMKWRAAHADAEREMKALQQRLAAALAEK